MVSVVECCEQRQQITSVCFLIILRANDFKFEIEIQSILLCADVSFESCLFVSKLRHQDIETRCLLWPVKVATQHHSKPHIRRRDGAWVCASMCFANPTPAFLKLTTNGLPRASKIRRSFQHKSSDCRILIRRLFITFIANSFPDDPRLHPGQTHRLVTIIGIKYIEHTQREASLHGGTLHGMGTVRHES